MKCLWYVLLGLAISQASTGRLEGQEPLDPVAANVAPVFAMIERSFVALAEAMPADRYDFAPEDGESAGVRTFAEQVKHVACGNFAFFNEVEGIEPPDRCDRGGPSSARTKTELLEYLRASFRYAQSVIAATTAKNLLDAMDGPYGGNSTRLALTLTAVWHASDHYGQLVVYLRANGIVPPASRPAGGP